MKFLAYTLEFTVNRFVCNILDIMHSSNSVLRSVGGGGEWGVGCIFFLEDVCDIVIGLFDTVIKQHNMISTDSIDSTTKIN